MPAACPVPAPGGAAAGPAGDGPILQPGATCECVATADRAALLVDNEAYFAVARQALLAARRSIVLLGWSFDPRTRLCPGSEPPPGGPPDRIGALLLALSRERPDLEVRILAWDMALPFSLPRSLYPQRSRYWFRGSGVRFRLAAARLGACHHQKLLVIDDALAFCSSTDFLPNRWDSPAHRHRDRRRRLPLGLPAPPVHEVTLMVDGAAAAALAGLARARWAEATGERLPAPGQAASAPWPPEIEPAFRTTEVGIARTAPATAAAPATREAGALHLRAIAAARHCIYLENQYLASAGIAAALAARLAEPDGPEVVLVCPLRAPSVYDRLLMDRQRADLVAWLRAQDRHGRLRIYTARNEAGRAITIHAKLAIVDDRLLRVGSANLNNRSIGLDTECDVAVEAADGPAGEPTRRAIAAARDALVGHFLGCADAAVAAAVAGTGSLIGAIEALDPQERRLRQLHRAVPGPIGRLIAHFEIGDPHGVDDVFRPWRRVALRRDSLQRLGPG